VLASISITVCLPDGGVFIVMRLEVLLLLRNTLITRLSSEESAFVLRLYLCEKEIACILISNIFPNVLSNPKYKGE
jgi:hypothetical protein